MMNSKEMTPIWKLLTLASVLVPQVMGSGVCTVGTLGVTACSDPSTSSGCAKGFGLASGACSPCGTNLSSDGQNPCTSCLIPGVVQACDSKTGFATSCIGVAGVINGVCVKGKTTGCNDQNAILCSQAGDIVFACKTNWSPDYGICQPSRFSRYLSHGVAGFGAPGLDPKKAGTEFDCLNYCMKNNPVNGLLGGWNYYGEGWCACKVRDPLAYSGLFVDINNSGIAVIAGDCASNAKTSSAQYHCQTVNFSPKGCLAVDGTACTIPSSANCFDTNAVRCDSLNPKISIACVANYALQNGICQPFVFSRYASFGTYLLDVPGTVYTVVGSENDCFNYCTKNNPVNGPLGGWNSYNGWCGCKIKSSVAYPTLFNDVVNNDFTVIVGDCASNAVAPNEHQCQTVTFSSAGCIAIDGTPCVIPTSTGCNDVNAQTCDSLIPSTVISCKVGYILRSNACASIISLPLARFVDMNYADGSSGNSADTLHSVSSPAACLAACPAVYGSILMGINFIAAGESGKGATQCLCRSFGQATPSISTGAGWTAEFVATSCAAMRLLDPSFISATCQDVSYVSGACLAIDGSPCALVSGTTATGCTDKKASLCDATNPANTFSCVQNYSLSNNVCQPSTFARFSSTQFYCGGTPTYYGIKSELLCNQKCSGSNKANGIWIGTQWISTTNVCYCFAKACFAPALVAGAVTVNTVTGKGHVQNSVVTLVGTCAAYPLTTAPGTGFNCQTVTYPASGCIASDGKSCQCLGSSKCDANGVSTACLKGFTLANGSCSSQ